MVSREGEAPLYKEGLCHACVHVTQVREDPDCKGRKICEKCFNAEQLDKKLLEASYEEQTESEITARFHGEQK